MRGWKQNKLLLSVCFGLLAVTALAQPAESVLKTGVWVKIGVTESGVFRLDQPTLARLNPAFATANPQLLRLYGNGGATLPQSNAVPRPADLTENAIQVTGEADGRFDAGDALLFFGQSPHVVHYDTVNRRFTHQVNVYSDTTFYFLTIGTAPGLRITERPAGNGTSGTAITAFDDYQFHEKDLTKLTSVRSGRFALGEYFSLETTRAFSFDMAGLVPNSPVRIRTAVVSGAAAPTQFQLSLNGRIVDTIRLNSVSGYRYDFQAVARQDTFLVRSVQQSPLQLTLAYDKAGVNSAQGYLDYIGIQARRELRQYDRPVWIRRLTPGRYTVRQATNSLRVWNVTNPLVPVSQMYSLSAAQEAMWSSATLGDYYVFSDNQLLTPVSAVSMPNQNLRAQAAPELLIITPATWRDEADRLAEFRRQHDKLSVSVITTQQVYNEFGSGQPDPTAIRDMVRYFYQKQPGQVRYLLLFGDATFDYRNILNQLKPAELANMVPVYESRESLHPVYSYSSDDYYGFMDANEGEWVENTAGDHKVDIGIGRLPVKSREEARTVVDKLIRYANDPTLTGDWQTRVMLVADDGDFNIHQQDVDKMAGEIERTAPMYRPERVFLDAYPQQSTANGQRAPVINQLINRAMNDGRLIINYSGHGGETGLAEEQVVTLQDILSWKNRRLPLLVTATCEFGRYDDPNINSGAELSLLSRLGGAIGLLTTTRPVFANTNLVLNRAFYQSVFTPVDGQMPRLGDVMRATKNNSLSGPVNRNFALLGDPSMRLAYPRAQVALTQVNGRSVDKGGVDTLRALQTTELTGEIRQAGQRLNDFTGTLRLTLYDKATTQTTLGTESSRMSYSTFNSPVFTGQVAVQQGRFTVRFVMPKDIDYAIGKAKLYAYAVRADSLFDAIGSYDSLKVGGSATPEKIDNQPPVVQLSVKDGQADGEVVRVSGPDVTLRISLSDDQGINLARSGLGHELTAQLGDRQSIILNDSYVATGSDGRQGEVLYTFTNVTPGRYTVRVKAWDINNNSAEGALTIIVSEKPTLIIRTLRASPNPVVGQTTLTLEHNRSGEPLDWILSVHDLNGRLFNRQTGQCSDCSETLEVGSWDGRADTGQILPNGLYIYQVQVRSVADGAEATSKGRLVLSR
ncbi:hypothetical protein DYU11_14225 [Fibrisoma montanum]|uniref:Gingipain domain-containing protein n=1 Tax=Fibrisoma montanum TaxID=2305895 RepID=A0A418M820_9BACT|nr:type IX secretion system sortase PorU [Fibrisoma montanum]RIV22191.1 hypothetical protein DYU11_14225 [Fibrisoma montanum]